ncbi:MAG: hypothetical protein J0I49_01000 [Pseudonocardia sp.]|uniref:hypothetical protein n=1 Tax=Pseudonocardia sp. TaxID=60912 RepID=UPI001AD49AE7|nr:hypothetical protein [Pseudonocardia sp.]MBN9096686.1 hypothetical protein [Pseudonocardia sp.]
MTRTPALIVCAGCGHQAAHHAKGRCARCYPSTRARMITCPDCGEARAHHRGGRCVRCYRHARTVLADCAVCGEHRATRAGTCQRCKQRRRAAAGTCTGCGRPVARLWSRRCARCAKTSWTVGSCADCLAWAASIAAGRCRACREFARRGATGRCRSCRRELAINRHGRCRLCVASRRAPRPGGEYDRDLEPGERAGIQLFLGDMHGQGRPSPSAGDQTGPSISGDDHGDRDDRDGQLELFAQPRVHHLDTLFADWVRSPTGAALQADLAGFAAARGWPSATTRAVGRGLARAALTEPAFDLADVALMTWLRRYRVPIGRLREFVAAHDLQPPPADPAGTTGRWAGPLGAGLPAAMATEVTAWLEVLTATSGRGRARARATIDHYTAAVAPALTEFAARYDSLLQVNEHDITAVLEPLRAAARSTTAVALRSLFATLKSRRLIFADPTRRVHPGRFPRRPVLGLDPSTRAGLLDQLTRPDHRLVVLLAGVHALPRADITGLRIDDVALPTGGGTATITVHGTRRGLDEPTGAALADWLRERRRRWPASANPHLLISTRSALGLGPVSTGYLRGVTAELPVTLHQLRADRLLTQARDTGGDPLSLHRLFGLSADTALRYCAELDPPKHATDSR